MEQIIISKDDVFANLVHSNYKVLVVLNRMGIDLGFNNKSIDQVAKENNIDISALLNILNLFCNEKYNPKVDGNIKQIPDLLIYLKKSHRYFLLEKIPDIQNNIKNLVHLLHDSKSEMLELFYNNYIEEVTEHIDYETETVFPYIEKLYAFHLNNPSKEFYSDDYAINIYGEHHEDIEDALKDLKNILIRHLPHKEKGNLRTTILEQLFELESDLFSHTRIEDEVLIPLVKILESKFQKLI